MQSSNPKKMISLYTHDLLIKGNMHNDAELLRREANLQPEDAVTIDTPNGFLYDWYSIVYDACICELAKLDNNTTEDASKSRGFLDKWVALLCTGGEVMLQWFPLFHDRYCAEIAKLNLISQAIEDVGSAPKKLCSIDRVIAKQVLLKMAFELRWMGVGKSSETGNAVGTPKRLPDWFSDEYSAELKKNNTKATKDSYLSEALIRELLPIFVSEYSLEIANRPNATQDSFSELYLDREIAKQVVRKMASDPRILEETKEWIRLHRKKARRL